MWPSAVAGWRRVGRVAFALVVLAAVALPWWVELVSEHIVRLEGVLKLQLLILPPVCAAGMLCLQPRRRIGLALAATVASSLIVWLVPLHAREHFANDVHRLRVGMSATEVERIMRPHVRGATGITDFFDTRRREQPYWDKTYYEAHGEHHSFDNFCLVTWEHGRVVAVQLHED